MATHSNILTWRIPWPEEPGGLQSMRSQRVRHGWGTTIYTHTRYIKSCIKCILFSIVEADQSHLSKQIWQDLLPHFSTHELQICTPNLLLIGFMEICKHSKVANMSFLSLTSWTEISRNKTSFSLMETQSSVWFNFWWHQEPKHNSETDSYPLSFWLPILAL